MATYKRADLLPRTLDNLLGQTFTDIEIIVVDDCSPDDTQAVLAVYAQRYPGKVRGFKTPVNSRSGAARNLGLGHVRGKYVAIMDDDDVCMPTRLEKQVAVLDSQPDIGLCFSLIRWVDGPGQYGEVYPGLLAQGKFPTEPKDVYRLLLRRAMQLPNQSIMARREVIQRYPFSPTIWYVEDLYMALNMAYAGIRMHGIPEVLVEVERSATHERITKRYEAVIGELDKLYEQIASEHRLPPATYRMVRAKQHLREARYFGWGRGFGPLGRAFRLAPLDPEVYRVFGKLALRRLRTLGKRKKARRS
jgi:glycosyltransferase involved in cell wall biosynthesis